MPQIQAQIIVRCWRLWLIVILATVVTSVSGCHHADRAEQQVAMRGEHLATTISRITESERRRTRQLGRSVDLIRATLLGDIRTSRANVDEFKRYWQRDWNRWIERPPVYRQQTRELLGGKPGSIGPDAITLFF